MSERLDCVCAGFPGETVEPGGVGSRPGQNPACPLHGVDADSNVHMHNLTSVERVIAQVQREIRTPGGSLERLLGDLLAEKASLHPMARYAISHARGVRPDCERCGDPADCLIAFETTTKAQSRCSVCAIVAYDMACELHHWPLQVRPIRASELVMRVDLTRSKGSPYEQATFHMWNVVDDRARTVVCRAGQAILLAIRAVTE